MNDNSSIQTDVAWLISSFDAYEPCWQPFCHGLRKYWPDCPFPVYFITNHKSAPCGKAIQVGKDLGWSGNLQIALDRIDAPYVELISKFGQRTKE